MDIIEEAQHRLPLPQNRVGARLESAAAEPRSHKRTRLWVWFSELVLLAMALALIIVFARYFYGDSVSSKPRAPVGKVAVPTVPAVPVALVVADEVPTVNTNLVSPKNEADTEIVAAKVNYWATAWASKDVEAYLAHYSDTFQPVDGLSHQQWVAQRRQRIARQSAAEIEISDLRILMNDQDSVTAQFAQSFKSVGFNEVGTIKELEMVKAGDGWKIIGERVITPGKRR